LWRFNRLGNVRGDEKEVSVIRRVEEKERTRMEGVFFVAILRPGQEKSLSGSQWDCAEGTTIWLRPIRTRQLGFDVEPNRAVRHENGQDTDLHAVFFKLNPDRSDEADRGKRTSGALEEKAGLLATWRDSLGP
jgi:hypothetical protein